MCVCACVCVCVWHMYTHTHTHIYTYMYGSVYIQKHTSFGFWSIKTWTNGEGNGNPLQYSSCLEKSMDRGVWWAESMGLHDWACVHKGGGRWVGSNEVVELKKKKKTWTKHSVLCNHMQKGGKKKYDLYLHNPKHHTANLHKTFYAMSIQSKQSEHRHTIWVCSNYVTEFSLALKIHTYGLAGPGFFFFFWPWIF